MNFLARAEYLTTKSPVAGEQSMNPNSNNPDIENNKMNNKALLFSIATFGMLGLLMPFTNGCAAQGTAAGALSGINQQQNAANSSAAAGAAAAAAENPALRDPSKATLTAPAKFRVLVATTKGDITIEVTRAWAPNGADRFYNMVKAGYLTDIAIFRAVKGFMFQFGIHGTPEIAQAWGNATIKDDPSVAGVSNLPGMLTFAQTGRPNSRSSQMFINLGNNNFLDNPRQGQPFVPFGQVVKGLDVVKAINTEYGENSPEVQGNFRQKGNTYIIDKYPNIDFIKSVKIVE